MSNSRFALRVLDYETYLVYLIVANRQFFAVCIAWPSRCYDAKFFDWFFVNYVESRRFSMKKCRTLKC